MDVGLLVPSGKSFIQCTMMFKCKLGDNGEVFGYQVGLMAKELFQNEEIDYIGTFASAILLERQIWQVKKFIFEERHVHLTDHPSAF